MSELIVEYTRLLMNDGRESDKFWMLKKRIDDDVNKVGVQIEMKRGTMVSNLIRLLKEGAVTLNDLDGFSDELTETIRSSINRY